MACLAIAKSKEGSHPSSSSRCEWQLVVIFFILDLLLPRIGGEPLAMRKGLYFIDHSPQEEWTVVHFS